MGCTPKGERGRYRGDEGGMHTQGGVGSIQGGMHTKGGVGSIHGRHRQAETDRHTDRQTDQTDRQTRGVVRVGCTPKGEWGRYRVGEGGMHAQGSIGVVRVGCTPKGEWGVDRGGEGGMHARGGVRGW